MKICIVHVDRIAREVLSRALQRSFDAEVLTYACCEDALLAFLGCDVFVVYNNFGPRKMNGIKGVAAVRAQNPRAFIIGVSSKPYNQRRFLPAGANAFLLRAGNEIGELVGIIDRWQKQPVRVG
ncbi:MAG: hypothetical protein ACOYZ7_12315 [Chloroflexota bacterium]